MSRPLAILLILLAAPALAAPAAPAPVEEAALAAHLAAEGVDGVVAVYDTAGGRLTCSRVDRCTTRTLPASTFKIPNSLIALETGVADGPDFALAWDGKTRPIAAWNHDHTLRTALRDSVVWYYQELARRVGEPRMRAWVARLGYGNADIGGGVDRFWLDGGALRISPVEQLDFLRRLEEGRLPVSARSRELVRELLVQPDLPGPAVVRGKTGWHHPGTPDERGWWVGWASLGDRTVYVAVLLFPPRPGVDLLPRRRAVAARLFRERGMLR